jgi:hypothetical protein
MERDVLQSYCVGGRLMKWYLSFLLAGLLSFAILSCSQDGHYTVASVDNRILVAQDKETMEQMIDCAMTHRCEGLSIMKLLPSRKVFFVESGTTVRIEGSLFSFSDARRVQILGGEYGGKEGWVYDKMLYQDRSNIPYQLAFAGAWRTTVKR